VNEATAADIASGTYTPSTSPFRFRFQATAGHRFRAKVWLATASEPTWTLDAVDTLQYARNPRYRWIQMGLTAWNNLSRSIDLSDLYFDDLVDRNDD